MEAEREETRQDLGEIVSRLRRRRRLSASALAELAGISRQHLWRIEKGIVANPGKGVIQRIAHGLSTSISQLVPTSAVPPTERIQQDSPLAFDNDEGLASGVERNLPDAVKVIAEFLAARDGASDNWPNYVSAAFELRARIRREVGHL